MPETDVSDVSGVMPVTEMCMLFHVCCHVCC